MGTDPKNTIQIEGLGMVHSHAKIKVAKDFNSISIEPLDVQNGKITLNGNQLKEKKDLKHKDVLVFGVKNAFKVIIPK